MGNAAYRPADFLSDVRHGIFREVYSPSVKIDAYRRNLQRGYLELIAGRLSGPQRVTDDERPMLRGELKAISAEIAANMAKVTDRDTRLHLEDVRDQIARILDPKFEPSRPAPAVAPAFPTGFEFEFENCWPDYAIRPQSPDRLN